MNRTRPKVVQGDAKENYERYLDVDLKKYYILEKVEMQRCCSKLEVGRWGSVAEYHCNLDFPSTAAILRGCRNKSLIWL